MTKNEVQTLIDTTYACIRVLDLIRFRVIQLDFMRIEGVVNIRTAILIRQVERLEAIHENLLYKIASPTMQVRRVKN